MRWNATCRLPVIVAAMLSLTMLAPPARAADPYEINAILSLTGPASFIGRNQKQAIDAVANYVNGTGGIGGRQLSFVVADDQSKPDVAVQLAQALIAKHVPVILGPSLSATCRAVGPLLKADGPVLYCLTSFGHPAKGSFIFATLPSANAMEGAVLRYFRDRGWYRIASIVSTDSSGQEAEAALKAEAAKPGNRSLEIVASEHMATTDISAAAQIARIKAANAQALFAWATGTAIGTLLQAAQDAGLDIPTVTSGANLNPAFFKQYAALLPKNLYFGGVPYYGGDSITDPATKAAIAAMTRALASEGVTPDQVKISGWDPALLIADALRKIGADASAPKLLGYLSSVHGWVGVNGPYDFRSVPQRGLGEGNVIVVRWDAVRNAVISVSKPGGAPLGGD